MLTAETRNRPLSHSELAPIVLINPTGSGGDAVETRDRVEDVARSCVSSGWSHGGRFQVSSVSADGDARATRHAPRAGRRTVARRGTRSAGAWPANETCFQILFAPTLVSDFSQSVHTRTSLDASGRV